MACESWSAKLEAYVDGELASSDMASLAQHLRQCAGCAAEALEQVQMKRAVAVAGKRYQPSAQLREKLQKSLLKSGRREGSWVWKIVALPATLVLVLSLAVSLYIDHEKTQRQRVYSELTDLHVATLASATPVDVLSTDRHTVKPWFQGKIPFSFNLPELQGTDFTLVGGRVTYLAQSPGAHLIYRLRQHEISVFIFQDRGNDAAALPSAPISMLSFTVESWTKNGLRYFVVGDVGAQDVENLGKLIRDAG
ncbi:MAG TPA: zf-HC2 domain-containing protein [Candidatus Sulfotelmatobacter sp.]|nr:zf-HC2 domain-containing protein [Candidatus Sulfotelmatobacter sp.]